MFLITVFLLVGLLGWVVGLYAGLCKNYWMDINTWWEDWEWAKEEPISGALASHFNVGHFLTF